MVSWLLFSYRVPREPSTPRIAIWRKLNDLGVAKVVDGLVALPDGDRNREQIEWLAVRAREAGGTAQVWVAELVQASHDAELRGQMTADRSSEYQALLDEVASFGEADMRTVKRWRRTWRSIDRRDYFGAPERERTRAAIAAASPDTARGTQRLEPGTRGRR